MSAAKLPSVPAHGAQIPQIGLGTWQLHGDVLARAVEAAAEAGYRHFDTAPRYENEADLGRALAATGLRRDSYFLTTKVWYTDLAAPALLASAEASLERLRVDQVDLLLIHWPSPDVPLSETIEALCEAARRGYARHIGVSNFPARLMEQAIALADRPLVANQCEYHPRLDQSALIETCRRNGMAFIAYSPIGSGHLLADPVIADIAATHGKSPAQIMLRWHLQQGVVAIPRSSSPERIRENIALQDFELSEREMARLFALNARDGRLYNPDWVTSWE
ncbi:aldo/keto reductase [Pseudodonghicola xiamenensis]|uniref:Oxidoreductase n=1 Tax=Pseudodonghicola xiamenensis TaxID=337702 RepID=A0A8J3ME70_9RHOB|nr:aldo/keto reductase [Pseudodonghicola xiamenensis]GHG96174.1 oxidoreductase [Pseudodonghicola xiamenensis]